MAEAEKDPTMEEILSSIRRIISEDDEEGGDAAEAAPEPEAAAPQPAPEPEPEPEPVVEAIDDDEDDVLELTDPVEDAPEAEAAPEPGPDFDDDVLEIDAPDEEPEPAPAPEPAAEPVAAAAAPAGDDRLVGDTAAAAASTAFAQLSRDLSLGEANNTLEALVREMLRPLLKSWLDENLPRIVEAKVEEEVQRLARR